MRLRDIIGLAIALVLAIGVALTVRLFLTKVEPTKPVVEQQAIPLTKVLVAGRNLIEGTKLRESDLVWQEWPQQYVNSVYLTEKSIKPESLKGSIVRFHILRGAPILLPNLVRSGETGLLSIVLSSGKRAVSIDVTPATASSGLIIPGDMVDVILAETVIEETISRGKSETILSNVKVVAIDTDLSTLGDKTKTPPHVATLEVTPDQAELLLAASKNGTLSLSLHSSVKGTAAVVKASETPVPAIRKPEKVLVIRGKERTTLEFQEK
jgi:pilus assembly protein CpaB